MPNHLLTSYMCSISYRLLKRELLLRGGLLATIRNLVSGRKVKGSGDWKERRCTDHCHQTFLRWEDFRKEQVWGMSGEGEWSGDTQSHISNTGTTGRRQTDLYTQNCTASNPNLNEAHTLTSKHFFIGLYSAVSVPNPPSDFGSSSSSSNYKEGLACIKARGMLGLGGSVHQPLCIHSLCAGGWLCQLSPYLQQSHLVRLEISPELESLMLYPSNHYTICKPKKTTILQPPPHSVYL